MFFDKKVIFPTNFFSSKKLSNHFFRRKNHFSEVFISNIFFTCSEWILRQVTQYYVLKNVYRENRFFVKKKAWKASKSHFSTKKSLFRRFYFKQIFFSRFWVNFTPRHTVLRFKKCLSRKSIFWVQKWIKWIENHHFRTKKLISELFACFTRWIYISNCMKLTLCNL